jgi:uncharacterized membrane protein YphA (DoxX/SURF4 family)
MQGIKNIGFLIGRIIVGLYYIQSGLNHFINFKMMSQYASSKFSFMPEVGVIISGILLIVGGFTILTGFMPLLGVLSLVAFFIPVTFIMHNFWAEQDPQMKMMQMIQFMKNMGLMGSALIFLAIPEPWPFSLTRRK